MNADVQIVGQFFSFRVEDEEGYWGDMRCWAHSESEARFQIAAALVDEAIPDGTLDLKTMKLIPQPWYPTERGER